LNDRTIDHCDDTALLIQSKLWVLRVQPVRRFSACRVKADRYHHAGSYRYRSDPEGRFFVI
jgi:hypothetical protein